MAEAMQLNGTLDRKELAAWIRRSNGEGPVVASHAAATRAVVATVRPLPTAPAKATGSGWLVMADAAFGQARSMVSKAKGAAALAGVMG